MSEFTSDLFTDLAAAAHISYDPCKPDDEYTYKKIFTNADARRMDAMKTTIMRILLLRARNYMVNNNEDTNKKNPLDREAKVSLNIIFTDENINHKGCDKSATIVTREDLEKIADEIQSGKSSTSTRLPVSVSDDEGLFKIMGTKASVVFDSSVDIVNKQVDRKILTCLINFLAPVETIIEVAQLQLNCKGQGG